MPNGPQFPLGPARLKNSIPSVAKKVHVIIPKPQVLQHDDMINAKYEADAEHRERVARQRFEERHKDSSRSAPGPVTSSGPTHGEKKTESTWDTSISACPTVSVMEHTPRIDRVLAMMRARLVTPAECVKEEEITPAVYSRASGAPISINVHSRLVIETAQEEEVHASDLRSRAHASFNLKVEMEDSQVGEETMNENSKEKARENTNEKSFSSSQDLRADFSFISSSTSSNSSSSFNSERGTSDRKCSEAGADDRVPGSYMPLPTEAKSVEGSSAEFCYHRRGLGEIARHYMRSHGACEKYELGARQEDVRCRLQSRQAREQALQHELVQRFRAAVIRQIVIQHKDKGLARASALLAPAGPLRSCRFLSRKRQRRSVQRVGKARLAVMFERHQLLRKGFASLLREAYASSGESEESEESEERKESELREESGRAESESDRAVATSTSVGGLHEWVYGTDPTGAPYYYNQVTGASQWEPPRLASGQWVRAQTEGTQRNFFWLNVTTGQASWELPPEVNID
jgi:hypothetical protein